MKAVVDAVNEVRNARDPVAVVAAYVNGRTEDRQILNWRARFMTALREASLWPPTRP